MREFFEPHPAFKKVWMFALYLVHGVIKVPFWLFAKIVLAPLVYLFSLPMKPIVPIVNLTAYWAGKEPSRKWHYVTAGSFVISLLSILLFMKPLAAVLVIFFLYLHELSHVLGFIAAKVRTYIVFILFLGAAAIAQDEDYYSMTEWQKSKMLLAGPVGSMISAGLCWIGSLLIPAESATFLMVGGFNMTLVLFNMVAWDGLDGGRTYQSIMFSLKESEEKFVAIPMIVLSIVVLGSVFLRTFRIEILIFFLFLMVIAFVRSAFRDNPAGYLSTKAMSYRRVILIVCAYMAIVAVGSVMYASFPDWTPLLSISPIISNNVPYIGIVFALVSVWMFAADIFKWAGGREAHYRFILGLPIVIIPVMVGLSIYTVALPSVLVGLAFVVGNALGFASFHLANVWSGIHARLLSEKPAQMVLEPLYADHA